MASGDVQLFVQAVGVLIAALVCAGGSLWLVSRLTAIQTPFSFSRVLEDYNLIAAYCDGTWRGARRYLLGLFLLVLTLKKRTPLGWVDMGITLGIASMALPGTLDQVIMVLQLLAAAAKNSS